MTDLVISQIVDDALISSGYSPAVLQAKGGKLRAITGACRTVRNPNWIKEEDDLIRTRLGDLSYGEIGSIIGRSSNAVMVRAKRLEAGGPTHRSGWITIHKASILIGVDVHSFSGWVKHGFIKGEIAKTTYQNVTMVNFEYLKYWLTRPNHWPYIKVKKMRPGYLRNLVVKSQKRWGDEWLSTRQVADMHGLADVNVITFQLRHGKIPGLMCPHIGGRDEARWSFWFVRRSVAEKWKRPTQKDIRVEWVTPSAIEFMLKKSEEGLTAVEIARMMKRGKRQVDNYIRKFRREMEANMKGSQWWDVSWNPVTGCTAVSEGCAHCYAKAMHERFYQSTKFEKVVLHPERLENPSRMHPKSIFLESMGDLFHKDVPFSFIDEIFEVIEKNAQHTFMAVTKRHGRMLEFFEKHGKAPDNFWMGVTVESQAHEDRIVNLLRAHVSHRFISYEPALGPLELRKVKGEFVNFNVLNRSRFDYGSDGIGVGAPMPYGIDLVICGGESGTGARPMNPDWARALRDQCAAAGVPFFFKQWGEWAPSNFDGGEPIIETSVRIGTSRAGRLLDGREWNELPWRKPVEKPIEKKEPDEVQLALIPNALETGDSPMVGQKATAQGTDDGAVL